MLWRTEPAGLSCRVGGRHTLSLPRLELTGARWTDQVLAMQLARDPQAQYWLGWSPDKYANRADLIRPNDPILLSTDYLAFVGRDRLSGRLVTHIGLTRGPGGYEVGGTVDPDLRGQGYGTEALAAVCELAHQHFGIARLRAGCETTNEASRRWLSGCGFVPADGPPRHTLPDGRVIDSTWWERIGAGSGKRRCRNW